LGLVIVIYIFNRPPFRIGSCGLGCYRVLDCNSPHANLNRHRVLCSNHVLERFYRHLRQNSRCR